ncbi:hypothetical protein TNCV_422361 [Trichonephila clavipes]|nr:hypothetical protein TNCV_422361 [Trichonephila clavipes]
MRVTTQRGRIQCSQQPTCVDHESVTNICCLSNYSRAAAGGVDHQRLPSSSVGALRRRHFSDWHRIDCFFPHYSDSEHVKLHRELPIKASPQNVLAFHRSIAVDLMPTLALEEWCQTQKLIWAKQTKFNFRKMLRNNNRKLKDIPGEERLSLEILDNILDEFAKEYGEEIPRHLEDIPADVRHSLEILDDILIEYGSEELELQAAEEKSNLKVSSDPQPPVRGPNGAGPPKEH